MQKNVKLIKCDLFGKEFYLEVHQDKIVLIPLKKKGK